MPIIETPSDGHALNQGDILRGVNLFATNEGWNAKGGEAAKAPFNLCLVVSRPCAIAHKSHVIVAAIEKYPDSVPKELDKFEKVLDFLTTARDGVTSPDIFYLGQLPALTGRYRAGFDSLHTIQIPRDTASLATFIKERRLACISSDFCRALHTRLFSSFATLGFDDENWVSTEDLNWLVHRGRTDILNQEAAVSELRTKRSSLEAEGKPSDEKSLAKADEILERLKAMIQPFEKELANRVRS